MNPFEQMLKNYGVWAGWTCEPPTVGHLIQVREHGRKDGPITREAVDFLTDWTYKMTTPAITPCYKDLVEWGKQQKLGAIGHVTVNEVAGKPSSATEAVTTSFPAGRPVPLQINTTGLQIRSDAIAPLQRAWRYSQYRSPLIRDEDMKHLKSEVCSWKHGFIVTLNGKDIYVTRNVASTSGNGSPFSRLPSINNELCAQLIAMVDLKYGGKVKTIAIIEVDLIMILDMNSGESELYYYER